MPIAAQEPMHSLYWEFAKDSREDLLLRVMGKQERDSVSEKKVATRVKEKLPEIINMAGGDHTTSVPEQTVTTPTGNSYC